MITREEFDEQNRRLDAVELLSGETATDLSELYDLLGYRIVSRKSFDRHRRILEGLVVNALGLSGPMDLITNGKRIVIESNTEGGELDSRIRKGQVVLYYLLVKHTLYGSYRVLEGHYGLKARYVFTSLTSLAQNEEGFQTMLEQIERRLMDAMELYEDPVLPIPASLLPAWKRKEWCKANKVPYRYVDVVYPQQP
ncbi:MAG: hypothetical protein EON58_16875 [Alphaproteobacteria bacterium]|nr:MAG: hypothetical protein EON58_16875 [Alphaproteobacteria bacterium]